MRAGLESQCLALTLAVAKDQIGSRGLEGGHRITPEPREICQVEPARDPGDTPGQDHEGQPDERRQDDQQEDHGRTELRLGLGNGHNEIIGPTGITPDFLVRWPQI